ncbi:MAG TPA: hypothetical protein PKH19_04960 [Candidatus Syntrophosphaera sp.]|nr:hypothetical protein [Candidatus Syntrophosphaera sp.]
MLHDQRGNTVFWVLSVILALALILILALSGKYNLDPEKNTDDCTTNMKNIWVATADYMGDTNADFQGDLEILRRTTRPNSKAPYLGEEKYCPESQGRKDAYQVFGKHATEVIDGTLRHYVGILILCPNLHHFPRHLLDKTFYDNMSISKLQTLMVNDIVKINQFTKSNGKLKAQYLQKYFDHWKNTQSSEFEVLIGDPAYRTLIAEVTGVPLDTDTEDEEE